MPMISTPCATSSPARKRCATKPSACSSNASAPASWKATALTETAPVIAMNTAMHTRTGTVGRFLPGIEWRLDPVPGIAHGGRLHVRGPNVMMGYMRATAPGVIESLADGWYDTGDIVEVDADGFIAIKGRAKRFAKIAGEMVSMTAAEALVASLWPDALPRSDEPSRSEEGREAAARHHAEGCCGRRNSRRCTGRVACRKSWCRATSWWSKRCPCSARENSTTRRSRSWMAERLKPSESESGSRGQRNRRYRKTSSA